MDIDERFQIDGGDGDQTYLSIPMDLKPIETTWFPGEISDFGKVSLFLVEGGEHDGEYIVLAPRNPGYTVRTLSPGSGEMAIAFRVTKPTSRYSEEDDLVSIGYAYVKRLR